MPIDARYYDVLRRLCDFTGEDPNLAEDAATVTRALGPGLDTRDALLFPVLHLSPSEIANDLQHVMTSPELEALGRLSTAIGQDSLVVFFVQRGFLREYQDRLTTSTDASDIPLDLPQIGDFLHAIRTFYGVETSQEDVLVRGGIMLAGTGEEWKAAEAERRRLAGLWHDNLMAIRRLLGVTIPPVGRAPQTARALVEALARAYTRTDAPSLAIVLRQLSPADIAHYTRSGFDLAIHLGQLAQIEIGLRANPAFMLTLSHTASETPDHAIAILLHDLSASIHDDTDDLTRLRDANAALAVHMPDSLRTLRLGLLTIVLESPLAHPTAAGSPQRLSVVQAALGLSEHMGELGEREAHRQYQFLLARWASSVTFRLDPDQLATPWALDTLYPKGMNYGSSRELASAAEHLLLTEGFLRHAKGLRNAVPSQDLSNTVDFIVRVHEAVLGSDPEGIAEAIRYAIADHLALERVLPTPREELMEALVDVSSILLVEIRGKADAPNVPPPEQRSLARPQELQDLVDRSPAFLAQFEITQESLSNNPRRALRTLNERLEKRTLPGSFTVLRATIALAQDILSQEKTLPKDLVERMIRATIMDYLLAGSDSENVLVLYPRHLPILLQDLAKKHEIPINHVFAQHYYRAQLSDVRRVVIGTRVMLERGDLAFRQRLETQVPPVPRTQTIETVDQLQDAVQKTVSAAGFPYTGAALAILPGSPLIHQDFHDVIALMARYEAALPPPTDRAPHDARLFQQIAHAFLGPKGLVSTESGHWQDDPQLIIDTITHCATAATLEASAREALIAVTTRAAHDFARTHREEERARRDTAQRKRAK